MLVVRAAVAIAMLGGITYGAVQVFGGGRPAVADGLRAVVVDANAARSLDGKFEALEEQVAAARRTGQRLPVTLTLTEQELTSKASQFLASADPTNSLRPSNVQIHLANGDVVITSTVQLQGLTLNVGIVAAPVVMDGKTVFAVKDIQTGGFFLPDLVKQQLSERIAPALDPASLGLPLDILSIKVGQGTLTVQGTTR